MEKLSNYQKHLYNTAYWKSCQYTKYKTIYFYLIKNSFKANKKVMFSIKLLEKTKYSFYKIGKNLPRLFIS